LFLMLGLSFFSLSLFAQEGDDLPSDEVQVIRIFEAQLAESERITLNPELPDLDTATQRQTYQIPPKSYKVEYPAPRIRPLSYKSDEEVPDVYTAYAKLGGGLPAAIYGEGSYHTMVQKSKKSRYELGANILHHSANFSDDEVENQRFSKTEVEGEGAYYFEQGFAVGANMGYSSNKVHYYGYSVDEFSQFENLEPEDVEQIFNIFDLGGQIFNGVQTAGDINYSAGFDFYLMGDDFASNETGLDFKLNGTKWIQERHSIDVGIRTDFSWYNDTMEIAQTLHNFTFSPAFTYHADKFKVKLGAHVVSHNDEFELFPNAEVVVNVTGNELAVYAGVEGNLQKNTFRSLTTYNPFIHTRLEENTLRNTKYFNVYGGVRGNFSIFEYTAQVGLKPTNDLALYFTDYTRDPIFDFNVIYDDVDIVNFGGSITARPIRGLEVTGTIAQNIYDVSAINGRAWHLPATEVNIQTLYTTMDGKLRGKAQFFFQNGVPFNERFGGVGRSATLNRLADLSVGGEYWVGKNFGLFLDVNNIFNNKRQRWMNYPTYGINFLGGISARF